MQFDLLHCMFLLHECKIVDWRRRIWGSRSSDEEEYFSWNLTPCSPVDVHVSEEYYASILIAEQYHFRKDCFDEYLGGKEGTQENWRNSRNEGIRSKAQNSGPWTKPWNSLFLNVIHHRQNPLESVRGRYAGCPRRNVPEFWTLFLMLKYADIIQNTYVQSWTVTEIMLVHALYLSADRSYENLSLSVVSDDGSHLAISFKCASIRVRLRCAVSHVTSVLAIHECCIVLGTLRTTMTWRATFL
jgi:hypothetical protein